MPNSKGFRVVGEILPGPVARALTSIERMQSVRDAYGRWPISQAERRRTAPSMALRLRGQGVKPSARIAAQMKAVEVQRSRAALRRAFAEAGLKDVLESSAGTAAVSPAQRQGPLPRPSPLLRCEGSGVAP